MAEKITVARPYAQAVFGLASDQKDLASWSETLRLLAAVASDEHMRQVVDNPRLTQEQIIGLIFDICGDALSGPAQALVSVLVDNGRLGLLPEIAHLYEGYRAAAERTVRAEVVSAHGVSDAQRDSIIAALEKRTGRHVELECRQDESLIGGAVIRAGDLVIDGSVTGHLDRLTSALSH